ncbi:MAG: hypothetical protein JK586_09270 [Nocardiopsis sp. BM-2018]|nr:MAG: hypothetical protein JK586_09270 [Nocardiopsis sp. BM-2018]
MTRTGRPMEIGKAFLHLAALACAAGAAWGYAQWRGLEDRHADLQALEESALEAEAYRDLLQSERDRSLGRVEDLDTDPFEMEAAVRRNKNLVAEDEIVFRIKELPPGP